MKATCQQRVALWLGLAALACGAVAQTPVDPRAQAAEMERAGRNAEAEALWRNWSAHHPQDAEAYAHIGQLAGRQEHYADAIAAYRKAMAMAPAMPGLKPNLGLAYFKNGEYRQAIEIFTPMAKASPADGRIALLVGMSHYGLAEYAAAVPYLSQAAEGDAQNLTLQMTLAHSCLYAHQYQCVLDAFHRIIALDANSAEAHILAGEALDEMKDPLGARRELEAAVDADPKTPNVHFGLGYLMWTKAEYPEAAAQFEAELVNNPQHPLATLYLADARLQMGKAAPADIEKAVQLLPENAMAHRDLGAAYAEAGRNEDAVREFQAAIRIAPNDANAHYRLARLYRAMGKTAEAKAEFDKTNNLKKAEDEHLVQVMRTAQPAETVPKQ